MNDIFKGIKVVELATFVAAASAARFFADLGADVIKVEAPSGDPIRFAAKNEGRPEGEEENTTFDLDNANKRGVILNLKSPAGKAAMMKLISEADIFITNNREASLARNGLDYNSLHAQFPSLVFGIITGYGDEGPDKDLPGYDFTAFFARGGVLGTLYQKGEHPMNLVPGFGDHQAGMYLAAAISAALYRAKTTGKGERVSVSLYHSAVYGMSLLLTASQYGMPATQYPMDRRLVPNPFMSTFLTKDGRYIQTAVPSYDPFYEKCCKAFGLEEYIGDERYCTQGAQMERAGEFFDILTKKFAEKTLAEWKEILTKADLPFSVAQLWPEVLNDPQAWESGILAKVEYPNGNVRSMPRLPFVFRESGTPDYKRGPLLGQHTKEVLKGLGYSDEEIDAMLAARDAVQHK